jgi:beta-lactam-binding protein with PASTA domain
MAGSSSRGRRALSIEEGRVKGFCDCYAIKLAFSPNQRARVRSPGNTSSTVTTMFFRRCSFVVMIVLSLTSAFHAQQPRPEEMILARPRPVPVPVFTGKTLRQVRTEAVVPGTAQALFASISSQGPETGVVATQAPKAGTPVVPGLSRLFLTMEAPKPSPFQAFVHQIASPQAKTARVPQLQGDTRDAASSSLETARLRPSFIGDAGGTVVQEYPTAGTAVPPESTVIVTLAIPPVSVPSLHGMTLEQATSKLREDSFQIRIEGENTSGGTVTSQYPPAGTPEPPGTQVTVTITPAQQPAQAPVPPIYVPNLEKMSRSDAESELAKVNLRTGMVKGPSTGFVSDQRPGVGSLVDPETAVSFTLSLPMVVVPDVMGDNEADATNSLKSFRLRAQIVRAKNWDAKSQHVVVTQTPSAGNNADVGSEITLVLGNLAPPPSLLSRVLSALPLAPWWMWLVVGLPLGVVGAGVLKKIVGPRSDFSQSTPAAQCTLTATRATATIRLGRHGVPNVQFTLGLRNGEGVARYRIGREPEVRRKR